MKNNTVEYLLKHGIKPSLQRIAVMEYLLEHKNHPTVDTIYAALAPKIHTLSKTTVYNALNLFYKQGAILALDIDDRGTRYDADRQEHGHFKCTNCGSIFDIFSLPKLPRQAVETEGFTIDDCQIYYKGCCPKCQKNNF